MRSILKISSIVAVGLAASVSFAQLRYHSPLVGKDIRFSGRLGKLKYRSNSGSTGKALVLFDSTGSFGWAGNLYAQQLANLLTHFNLSVTMEPVSQYQAGQLGKFDAGFYLGFVYNEPLPDAFKADVLSDQKPFCWTGFNLWQVAWTGGVYQAHDPVFVGHTGIRFVGLDDTGYPTVSYKNTSLQKDQSAPVEGLIQIDNPAVASAVATSVSADGTTSIPYIVDGNSNFWYVADNPMMAVSLANLQDRVLAFSDTLFDMLHVKQKERHRAFIRIEDVSVLQSPATLRAIADTLAAEKIPYVVCVIPEFVDPFGVYTNGVPADIPMMPGSDFVKALKYMQSKGGQIIMHGLTHQYSNVPNPFDGVSADDFEFFRVTQDGNGNKVMLGPVPEDSAAWVHNRIMTGLNELARCGFYPNGWNTPHYMASSIDYDEFANDFDYSLDRSLTFANLPDGTLTYLTQFSPFTFTDEHGMYRLPETLNYLDPYAVNPVMPVDLQARAHANLVVRDGWAGCYFHPFLPVNLLKELVDRIKSEGYTFVNPSKYVDAWWNN